MKKALVLINKISGHPTEDELDVLVQAESVKKSMNELGYECQQELFDLDLTNITSILKNNPPDLVFNLVETVDRRGELIHFPPSLLESFNVPFTGSGSFALMLTTNKIRTKNILKSHGLPTPVWFTNNHDGNPDKRKKYIIKPAWEDGSAGITDNSIIAGDGINLSELSGELKQKNMFIEEYIHGREFNLSVIGGKNGPELMPVAEMQYLDFPEDKPRILNYASKWDTGSFEYSHTVRTFEITESDRDLSSTLADLTRKCWDIFELRGYARVDFRADENNNPYILEINTNPCLSPDAGFTAACAEAGLSYTEMINRIIQDAHV
jgi:D-alanine-D-alanine ligase